MQRKHGGGCDSCTDLYLVTLVFFSLTSGGCHGWLIPAPTADLLFHTTGKGLLHPNVELFLADGGLALAIRPRSVSEHMRFDSGSKL
jgi:hypothetical protein